MPLLKSVKVDIQIQIMHFTSRLLNSVGIFKFDEEKQLCLFGQPMHQKLPLHMHSYVHVTSQLIAYRRHACFSLTLQLPGM